MQYLEHTMQKLRGQGFMLNPRDGFAVRVPFLLDALALQCVLCCLYVSMCCFIELCEVVFEYPFCLLFRKLFTTFEQ
jgi:hypothetical protein